MHRALKLDRLNLHFFLGSQPGSVTQVPIGILLQVSLVLIPLDGNKNTRFHQFTQSSGVHHIDSSQSGIVFLGQLDAIHNGSH